MKLKVVVTPVSDVDRAKSVYSNLGWWRKSDADLLLTCVLSAVGQSGKQEVGTFKTNDAESPATRAILWLSTFYP
jgi:hypothetical protein